jgi:hypothetical protein
VKEPVLTARDGVLYKDGVAYDGGPCPCHVLGVGPRAPGDVV